jgi:release factor glutamine methyltransferase
LLSDISAEALAVAKKNMKKNNVDLACIESDLFQNITGKFDLIVSNPPYIPTGEISLLMPEVRDHDPVIALDGKEDGLAFYRRIITGSCHYLEKNGMLCFEIGYNQAEAVKYLMKETGFEDIEVKKDLAGFDRIVMGNFKMEERYV